MKINYNIFNEFVMNIENIKKDHKWGFNDTSFEINNETGNIFMKGNRYLICGYEMPRFIPYLKEQFVVDDLDINDLQKEKQYKIRDSIKNEKFLNDINKIKNSTDSKDRLIHSHGQTSASEIQYVLYSTKNLDREVDIVLYPVNSDEIQQIISAANKHNVCIIPYGGGTSVSCALKCPKDEKRMIASVDMKNLNQLISIDLENNLATFGAGITGKRMEEILAEYNYTSGHEPDSMEFSTLGGWISTNASGMKKTKYGNIEDIVVNYKLFTSIGLIEKSIDTPRNSYGSVIHGSIFGSEGNFGIITEATIKISKKSQIIEYQSLIFKNFNQGVRFMKDLTINHSNLLPASIRLVDNNQLKFAMSLKPEKNYIESWKEYFKDKILENYYGFDKNEMVLCTLTFDSSYKKFYENMNEIQLLASKYDGISAGSSNGKKGYQLTFAIAYIRDFLNKLYIIGETFETSVAWNNITNVCKAVEYELELVTKDFKSKPFLSYRITQTYKTGVCIYFMLGIYYKGVSNIIDKFEHIEDKLRMAILKEGGSISHHHGIGKHRSSFLINRICENERKCIESIKNTIDPKNIFGIKNGIFDDSTLNKKTI